MPILIRLSFPFSFQLPTRLAAVFAREVDDFGVLEAKATYSLELLKLDVSKIEIMWLSMVLEAYVAL